jgi:hypothetical protein
VQWVESAQVSQFELHDKHFPELKYFPRTHPGLQVFPSKMKPSLQAEQEPISASAQIEQAELHCLQVLELLSPYWPVGHPVLQSPLLRNPTKHEVQLVFWTQV